MLSNTAAAIGYDTDKEGIMNAMPDASDVSVLPNLPLIPKKEPIDWNVSFEDPTAFENNVNTIIPFTTPYKIKDPVIVLERCDKILEISNHAKCKNKEQLYQVPNLSHIIVESVQGGVRDAGIEWDDTENVLSSAQNTSSTSYIKYQPVLESINNILPSFKLAVKDKQKLFSCLICGQTYVKPHELRQHRRETHGENRIRRSHKKPNTSTSDQKNSVTATQSSKLPVNNNVTKRNDAMEDIPTKSVGIESSVVPNSSTVGSTKLKNIPTQSETHKNVALNIVEAESKQSHLETKEQQKGMQVDKDSSVTCTLCRNTVVNLKTHLENYHKICCTDVLLAELEQCFTKTKRPSNQKSLSEKEHKEEALPEKITESLNNNDNESTKDGFDDTELKHINAAKEVSSNKRKRRSSLSIEDVRKRTRITEPDINSSNSNNGVSRGITYKCDICLGVYDRVGTFTRHAYKHYIRGETKENFHNFKNVYKNSPLYSGLVKSQSNERNSSKEILKPGDFVMPETRSMRVRRHTTASCINDKSTERFSCMCGRSFRFAYNLMIHKNHAKCSANKMATSDYTPIKNGDDKDSSASLSLTIKKKNNLYHVINSGNADDGNTENTEGFTCNDLPVKSLDINDTNSTDDAIIIDEVHKYSKDHIILKLESAEEDSVVNIEDDSDIETSTKCSEKQSVLENTTICRKRETDDIINGIKELETKKVAFKPESVEFRRPECLKDDVPNSISTQNFLTTCTCNKKFISLTSLHRHVIQSHPLVLRCGYCKVKHHNLEAYQKHVCEAVGETFDDCTLYISCYKCETVTNNLAEYDQHIATEHASSVTEYRCHVCTRSFSTPKARELHFGRCHITHHCTICGASVRPFNLRKHEGYHHGVGIPCHPCKTAFVTVKRYDKHMAQAHAKWNPNIISSRCRPPNLIPPKVPSGPVTCMLCDTKCNNEASLVFHISTTHFASYPWFKCRECHMFAATRNSIERHIQTKSCSGIRRKTTHF